MLNREFDLKNSAAMQACANFLESNWEPLLRANSPLRVIVTDSESKRNQQQNRYYWKAVIGTIADQAWVSGRQYSKDAWHELMAQQFGIKEEIELPGGHLILRRKSTTDMKVREFAAYIEQVTAWAAAEMGIRFPAPEY